MVLLAWILKSRYVLKVVFKNVNDTYKNQHDIASKGGKASGGSFTQGSERAKEAGRKGGSRSRRTNTEQDVDDDFEGQV